MYNYSQAHICQCLGRLATVKRNSIVTITGDRQKTGEEFVQSVRSLARGLLGLGLRSGDVVAICAYNSDGYLEWLLAVALIGGIVAPLNYRWSIKEASSAMLATTPVILVTDESCKHWRSELDSYDIPSLKWHVSMDSPQLESMHTQNVFSTDGLKENSVRSSPLSYSWAPEGAVIICFTSGTTGRPKGVIINHAALVIQALAKIAIIGYGEDDVYLHTAPLCHIGGLSSAMAMLMVGACHVMMPKFEARVAHEAIEQHLVTSFIIVPAMMADLVTIIRSKETWTGSNSVKKILNGGGSLSNELIRDATKYFPKAKLFSAYGMTETCSSITFMTLCAQRLQNPSHQHPQGVCVGKSAPHIDIKISTDGSSHVGRILTRGPHVMLRYWDQTSLKKLIDSDNWLDTGDIGWIDDSGHLWLIGRQSGRIKSGGENVYPEEVEAILLHHPGVVGVVIVGIPDKRLTEMVVACIKLKENWQWFNSKSDQSNEYNRNKELVVSREVLRRYCQQKNLTGFKIPKIFILWRKPFPLTSTGKIRRDEVQREVMSHLKSLPSNL